MSIHINHQLPDPEVLKQEIPMSDHAKAIKKQRDQEIRDIFEGKDDRFILIVGPCSADHEESVLEYCHKLAQLNEVVKDRLMIIPRVYTNKPRTTCDGYKACCTSRTRTAIRICLKV